MNTQWGVLNAGCVCRSLTRSSGVGVSPDLLPQFGQRTVGAEISKRIGSSFSKEDGWRIVLWEDPTGVPPHPKRGAGGLLGRKAPCHARAPSTWG